MKKTLVGLSLFFAAVLVAVAWYIYPTNSSISIDRPQVDTPILQTLPPSTSNVVLPITISLESLEKLANDITPESQRGFIDVSLGKIEWFFSRTSVKLFERGGKLYLSSAVNGLAEYGLLSANVAANISASTLLQIDSNWRVLLPELKLKAKLTNAEFFGFIEVKSLLQSRVDNFLDSYTEQIQSEVKNDRELKNLAREAWEQLCNAFPVDPEEGLWLELRPTSIRAAQPIIEGDSSRLQLGLDAETQIVVAKTSPNCDFPELLVSAW